MTPSEIAVWLDALVVDEVDYEERIIHKAAATIRTLEAKNKIATEAVGFVAGIHKEGRESLRIAVHHSRTALARIKEV